MTDDDKAFCQEAQSICEALQAASGGHRADAAIAAHSESLAYLICFMSDDMAEAHRVFARLCERMQGSIHRVWDHSREVRAQADAMTVPANKEPI